MIWESSDVQAIGKLRGEIGVQSDSISFLVKFEEGSRLKGAHAGFFSTDYSGQDARFAIRISSAIDGDTLGRIELLVERAKLYTPGYEAPDFSLFFHVDYDGDENIGDELLMFPEVENIQRLRDGRAPELIKEDPCVRKQGYLGAAPLGCGAEDVCNIPGGEGQGVKLVDVEEAWDFQHEEIRALGVELVSGVNGEVNEGHGTAVLGIVAARRNGIGIVGIAPCLDFVGVSSIWETKDHLNIPRALVGGLEGLRPGDVLLLEIEQSESYTSFLPIETDSLVFELIRLGIALGIVIVESAGNGAVNLDGLYCRKMESIPRRRCCIADSGAIIAGGCQAKLNGAGHEVLGISNYGGRVDCYAWGESVYSAAVARLAGVESMADEASPGNCGPFYGSFSGTSAAGAIIAGVAASIQGMARALVGSPLKPASIRALLRDPRINTPINRKGVVLGMMPDLRRISETLERRFDFVGGWCRS